MKLTNIWEEYITRINTSIASGLMSDFTEHQVVSNGENYKDVDAPFIVTYITDGTSTNGRSTRKLGHNLRITSKIISSKELGYWNSSTAEGALRDYENYFNTVMADLDFGSNADLPPEVRTSWSFTEETIINEVTVDVIGRDFTPGSM